MNNFNNKNYRVIHSSKVREHVLKNVWTQVILFRLDPTLCPQALFLQAWSHMWLQKNHSVTFRSLCCNQLRSITLLKIRLYRPYTVEVMNCTYSVVYHLWNSIEILIHSSIANLTSFFVLDCSIWVYRWLFYYNVKSWCSISASILKILSIWHVCYMYHGPIGLRMFSGTGACDPHVAVICM